MNTWVLFVAAVVAHMTFIAAAALMRLLDRWDKKTGMRRGTTAFLAIVFSSLSLIIGGVGLVTTRASAEDKSEPTPSATRKIAIRGKCVDQNSKPLANVLVRVMEGRLSSGSHDDAEPKMLAECKSDAVGNFAFTAIEVAAPSVDPRIPFVTAMLDGHTSVSVFDPAWGDPRRDATGAREIPVVLWNDPQALSGIVTDASGRPVVGAKVSVLSPMGEKIPGIWTSVTDRNGRYSITDLKHWKVQPPEFVPPQPGSDSSDGGMTLTYPKTKFLIEHPDHVTTTGETAIIPNQVDVTMRPTAIIEGHIVDAVTGKPAAAVLVRAKGIVFHNEFFQTRTDRDGRYRLQVVQDYYNVWAEAEDRIAVVMKAVKAVPGTPLTNTDFQLIQGGFVVGTVIDEATNRPLAGSIQKPTYVAHYGPACIKFQKDAYSIGVRGLSIGVQQNTRVNPDGTFRLRVAPGKNCVFYLQDYFEPEQASQIVSVEEGREKRIELRVKKLPSQPETQPGDDEVQMTNVDPRTQFHDADIYVDEEVFDLLRRNAKIDALEAKAAAAKVGETPYVPGRVPSRQRRDSAVDRLFDKFERQSVGRAQFSDSWLRTIKEIVDLGPAAVPDMIEELDATQDPWMLQLLGFTLRAIDDRRAVPTLIRAIPRTLRVPEPGRQTIDPDIHRLPPTKHNLRTGDPELLAFARKSAVRSGTEGDSGYEMDSPLREICGALTKLTAHRNGEEELFHVELDELTSPPQMLAKRQLFQRVSKEWTQWWEQHQNDEFSLPRESADEEAAIQKIESKEVSLTRDGTWPGRPVTGIWFRDFDQFVKSDLNLLKHFANLQSIEMPNYIEITDDGMKAIGELPNLKVLYFEGNKLSRSGLRELGGLKTLNTLYLERCRTTNEDLIEVSRLPSLTELTIRSHLIDDRGVKELRKLHNLTTLNLRETKVTDAGLIDLKELKNLTHLELRDSEFGRGGPIADRPRRPAVELEESKVTDAGLRALSQLTKLVYLDLSGSAITGEGFQELTGFENLTVLYLKRCRIDDAGLKEISRLRSLNDLYLSNNKVTDEGLRNLEQMKDLKYLELQETEVTREGIMKLEEALPRTSIRG